jgi:hypothetical protein
MVATTTPRRPTKGFEQNSNKIRTKFEQNSNKKSIIIRPLFDRQEVNWENQNQKPINNKIIKSLPICYIIIFFSFLIIKQLKKSIGTSLQEELNKKSNEPLINNSIYNQQTNNENNNY